MNRTRACVATIVASTVLITGCGSDEVVGRGERAADTQLFPAAPGFVTPGESRGAPRHDPSCPYPADAIERMLESGQPLPRCVRKRMSVPSDEPTRPTEGPGAP